MANRSYLYSVNEIPTAKNHKDLTLKGISEFNYGVPLVHLILVSSDTKTCPSFFMSDVDALIGNYEKGLKTLTALFELMKKKGVDLPGLFNEKISESLKFLERTDRKQKYFLLEPFEILDMDSGPHALTINTYKEWAAELFSYIEDGDIEAINEFVGEDILTHYEEHMGFGSWSEVLYWSQK
jgi:hypothetical protein